uniref:Uncharacterized protein n=1 Tax=Corethron hystrix TaxID=216773 RepID=A0A7S1BQ19_9STRA
MPSDNHNKGKKIAFTEFHHTSEPSAYLGDELSSRNNNLFRSVDHFTATHRRGECHIYKNGARGRPKRGLLSPTAPLHRVLLFLQNGPIIRPCSLPTPTVPSPYISVHQLRSIQSRRTKC